jgi:DNA-binding MarR family transcriptional regulator
MKYTEILIRIRQIVRSVNLETKRIQKEHGISIPQLLCLNFLSDRKNFQASHKEIKDFLQLNASTVTGIISRLVEKGLIARLPKQQDRRIGLIILTAKGAELLKKTPEPLHEQLSIKLRQLSPQKIQKLQESFDTINEFLNIEKVDAAPIITASIETPK